MRRAYHILHLLLIAAMLVAAVSMARGDQFDHGSALDLRSVFAI